MSSKLCLWDTVPDVVCRLGIYRKLQDPDARARRKKMTCQGLKFRWLKSIAGQ